MSLYPALVRSLAEGPRVLLQSEIFLPDAYRVCWLECRTRKEIRFFQQIKKTNQLNAVCRGCIESVRFGFSFALLNGHVFLLFLRAEKSKNTFLGWLQAAIYYMQGELGWFELKDILLSHVLVPCSCSVARRGAKSTAAK